MTAAVSMRARQLAPGRWHLRVAGELDLFSVPDVRRRVDQLTADGTPELIIDLSDTSFVDSSGVSLLMAALRRVRSRGGKLVVVDGDRGLRRAFEITGIAELVPIASSLERAIAGLSD